MGLDLRLLPFDGDGDLAYSHTVLECGGAYDIWDALEGEAAMKVPDGFNSFSSSDEEGETHYGQTTETPYGEPLMFVEVESLLKLKDDPIVTEWKRRRAVWAYLAELEPRTKIALYWH